MAAKTKTKKYVSREPGRRFVTKKRLTVDEEEPNIIDVSTGGSLPPEEEGAGQPMDTSAKPAKDRYPAPKTSIEFVKRWNKLIGGIVSRENFKIGHLYQLEILCDLYVEYDVLAKFVRTKGYTYAAVGRQGRIIKPYPEVTQMNRVQSEIRSYSKMLGLLLATDRSGESGGEDNEWA